MAKKVAGKAKKSMAKKKVPSNRGLPDLDAPARAFAAELLDPCGAALASPLYGGSAQGYLARCQGVLTVSTDATNDGFRYVCVPGAWDPDTDGVGKRGTVMWTAPAPAGTGTVPYTYSSASVPGSTYLPANAVRFRAVAACVEVTYIGKETDRAGLIGLKNTNYVDVVLNGYSASQALNSCPRQMRTPNDTVVVRWVPGEGDSEWNHFSAATDTDTEREKSRSGIEVAIVGTGSFRIRSTIIYEWVPRASNDVMSGMQVRGVSSRYNLGSVLSYLGRFGDWMYASAHEGAAAASKLAAGYGAAKKLGTGFANLALGM